MTETTCRYGIDREEQLLAYVYEELDGADRREFDAHLAGCEVCRVEIDGFRTVRAQLAEWKPPAFVSSQFQVASRKDEVASRRRGLRLGTWDLQLPAWAQVAAALLFLGVSAAIANLNVHYDASGLTVRTGWAAPASAPAPAAAPAQAAADRAPWRSDLTALEQQLRTEMRANAAAAHGPATSDAETLRRVRALIDESERRQQRDLALRVAEVMRDVDVQRRTDLTRISQSLGQIQNNTGMEVMRQRQLLNYIVTASQKQP